MSEKKKIIGVTVGTTRPRANLGQTDPKKSDYIMNRPVAKTEAMTSPVGVDENGDLWTEPPGKGANGKSAYELAVDNGYKGTEAEWLDSLHGKDGENGANGADGQDGKDGGHYTPSVKDNGNGTMTVSFTASKAGMAAITPVTISLPVPADGEDGQDGQDGANGKDGENGGYYTPTVETVTENSFKISFSPSKSGMPSVGDVTITLPTAKDGTNGTNGQDGKDGEDFDPSVITLGIYTDGLLYIFYNGQPVGNGVALPSGVSGDVVGNVDSDNNILFTGTLTDGVYTLHYADDEGNLIGAGTLTVEAVRTKYTITWIVDGKTYNTMVEEGVVPTFNGSTEKADDDQYTYTFSGWSPTVVAATANAKYTALYEQTEKEVEPAFVNLIDEAGYKLGMRISNGASGEASTTKYHVLTGLIHVGNVGDVYHVRGVDSLIAPASGGDYAGIRSCWDVNGVYIDNTVKTYPRELAGTDENGDLTLTYTAAWGLPSNTAYIRLQFYDADGSVPSLIVSRNKLIPKD